MGDEAKRLDAKKQEIETIRVKEEERRKEVQEKVLKDAQEKFKQDELERQQRGEEVRMEEQRQRMMIEKELRTMQEERLRLEEAKKLLELEEDADIWVWKSPDPPKPQQENKAEDTSQKETKEKPRVLLKAMKNYAAKEEGELSFDANDVITLLERDDNSGWWIGELKGVMGLFPSSFVEETK